MYRKFFHDTDEERPLYFFEDLSRIPRESGNEEAIGNYLLDFAEGLGLEHAKDAVGNVIIKKPGSKGREDEPPVILQAHMDMVCEKTSDSSHDFTKDPIELLVKGDMLSANKTTLGADDGIGVAMCMASIYDDTLSHPPIEILITVEEETTFKGAAGADPKYFDGRRVINLDHAVEHQVLAGSCGGTACQLDMPVTTEAFDAAGYDVFDIKVDGMNGGHSGEDIHRGYGSAIQLLIRALRKIRAVVPGVKLLDIKGGTNRLAISRDAKAVIAVPSGDAGENAVLSGDSGENAVLSGDSGENAVLSGDAGENAVLSGDAGKYKDLVKELDKVFRTEYGVASKGVELVSTPSQQVPDVSSSGAPDDHQSSSAGTPNDHQSSSAGTHNDHQSSFTDDSFRKIVELMSICPDGLQKMNGAIHGVVESSLNIGEMRIKDGKFEIVAEIRGAYTSTVDDILEKVETVASLFDAEITTHDRYSPWPYDPDSKLRKKAIMVYKDLFGESLEPMVVHAGIECGLFMDTFDELDAISLGPDCWSFHSPDEHMSISSAKREWQFLKALLANI